MDDISHKGYFDWLCEKVGGIENHYFLLKRLFKREFYSIVPNDDNRALDGLELRHQYNDENNCLDWAVNIIDGKIADANLDGPCTILEMMVALARRCEWGIMHDDELGDRTDFWFWELCKNVGLDKYTDDNFDEHFDIEIDRIVDIVVERRYSKYGKGGLFPLKNYKKNDYADQRNVELWYQLSNWLNENYPISE